MKKIAHVQVMPKLSGVQQISLDILCGLVNKDIKKYVICGSGNNDELEVQFREVFSENNIEVITVSSLKRNIGLHDIRCFIELFRLFKKERFDIVHTNSTKPGIIARIAAKISGVPKIIHTVHGIAFHKHESPLKRVMYYILENIASLFGDENVTVNKIYRKYYPFVKSKVIYNGVDFNSLNFQTKTNDDTIHFAYMARLDEQKNPLEFIKAIKIVVDSHPQVPVRFTLAGRGELEDKCIRLIAQLGLTNIIKMPGWISDKNTFYNSVDVLCQPSKWEAFGLVFVEAAYFHIPSISRSVEGIPEVIRDGNTGLLYSGDENDLAHKMMFIINEQNKIQELGLAAHDYVINNFNQKNMVDEYVKLYGL
ncbi:glycosyltransferase family 4 protein [Pluralibacter gergoviae]|nr:glycosyltransferase family 4 protein [Pluralibacter gergoviae]ELW9443384.1 glycosyltransferase family 4 protein [Pluralibacter gergoviae]